MRKLNIFIIVSIVIIVILIGSVSATTCATCQTDVEEINAFDLFWSNLKYQISNLLFTSAGQARDCSVYPDKTISHSTYEEWDSYDYRDGGCSESALINTFYDNFFYREYEDYFTEWDGLEFDEYTWIEFYCCPYPACDRDSDCEDPHGDTCNTAYGSCYYEEPDWETDVYRCEDTGWEFWQDVDFGSNYWCNAPDKIMWYHPDRDSRQCYEDSDDAVDCVIGNGVPNGNGEPIIEPGEEPSCKEKEEIFYTNAEGKREYKNIFFGLSKEVTPQIIDKYVTGFSNRYFEFKEDACCEDFEYIYVDTIEKEITPFSILLGILGKGTVDFTYDVYKCVPEGEAGFCLEFAHRWLNQITKTDDCQTNTIILIVIIIGGGILITRLI